MSRAFLFLHWVTFCIVSWKNIVAPLLFPIQHGPFWRVWHTVFSTQSFQLQCVSLLKLCTVPRCSCVFSYSWNKWKENFNFPCYFFCFRSGRMVCQYMPVPPRIQKRGKKDFHFLWNRMEFSVSLSLSTMEPHSNSWFKVVVFQMF